MSSALNGTGVTFSDGTTQSSGVQAAKAWVNFNGAAGASPTIRTSYNVSSVVRTATGQYTITFTTAFADGNYAYAGMASNGNNTVGVSTGAGNPTTTTLYVSVQDGGNVAEDGPITGVMIYR